MLVLHQEIKFFLVISICWWTIFCTKNQNIFPKSKSEIKKSNRESNLIAYPEKQYLPGSVFLLSLTTPNKQWVLLNRAPTSTHLHPPPLIFNQIHPPPPSSTHLHPAHFSLLPALCNILNKIWTKILHVIGKFAQI